MLQSTSHGITDVSSAAESNGDNVANEESECEDIETLNMFEVLDVKTMTYQEALDCTPRDWERCPQAWNGDPPRQLATQ